MAAARRVRTFMQALRLRERARMPDRERLAPDEEIERSRPCAGPRKGGNDAGLAWARILKIAPTGSASTPRPAMTVASKRSDAVTAIKNRPSP